MAARAGAAGRRHRATARPGPAISSAATRLRSARRTRSACGGSQSFAAGRLSLRRAAISITNQWRIDNDPPFPPLADFVAAWNRLGLKPALRLTTVSKACEAMEKAVGDRRAGYEGEWTDWWANGTASAPARGGRQPARQAADRRRPVAALGPARRRGRATSATPATRTSACSTSTPGARASAWPCPTASTRRPSSTRRAAFAYRPMARPSGSSRSASARGCWARAKGFSWPTRAGAVQRLGHADRHLPARRLPVARADPAAAQIVTLRVRAGVQPLSRPQVPDDLTREDTRATFPDNVPRQVARFWVERLDGDAIRAYRLSTKRVPRRAGRGRAGPRCSSTPGLARVGPLAGDEDSRCSWPASATSWPSRSTPSPRGGCCTTWPARTRRRATASARRKCGRPRPSRRPGDASRDAPHAPLHAVARGIPGCTGRTRTLEVWKGEPRARLTVRFNRLSSEAPEVFFVAFPLPCEGVLPRLVAAACPSRRYATRFPGPAATTSPSTAGPTTPRPTATGSGSAATPRWSRRARPSSGTVGPTAPAEPQVLSAMVFNNFWYTNFVADSTA